MDPQYEERRLTTILSAEVVGYSRLMAADEAGTLDPSEGHILKGGLGRLNIHTTCMALRW